VITIDSLGLSFKLPPVLQVAEDPGLLFLARSIAPPAVFSIDRDNPAVVNHEPQPGESVAPADFAGVDAVIVTNATLKDLPADVAAMELLVANGDRSFTVILSAPEPALGLLWRKFIASVRIEPEADA
jgi:hypothetical protein